MSQQPQIQRFPDYQDVITVLCNVVDGQPSYTLHKQRIRYLSGHVLLSEPIHEDIPEHLAFMHLLEIAKSMGIKGMVERDGLALAVKMPVESARA